MSSFINNILYFQNEFVAFSFFVVSILCVICVKSDKIPDGIWGKTFISIIAFGSLGLFSKLHYGSFPNNQIPEATIAWGIALFAIREIIVVYFVRPFNKWYYAKFPHMDRRLNCRGCFGTNEDGTKRCPNEKGNNNDTNQ